MKEQDCASLDNVKCISRTYNLDQWKINIRDYRIDCRGDDTPIYIKNSQLWERLPRGLAFIEIFNLQDETNFDTHIISGVRKFEYEETKLGYNMNSPSIVEELYMTKENGECCHISGLNVNGQHFWVIGSKNVHAVVRDRNDIALLTEERYYYCCMMANLFFDIFENKLTAIQQQGLKEWLNDYRFTLCAEACFSNSQHIVDYNNANELIFFAITHYKSSEGALTAIRPKGALELFKSFNLKTPRLLSVKTSSPLERESLREFIFNEPNSEGAVVYCVDDTGACRFIYKYKNAKYIIERAVREIMRRRGNSQAIDKRISNLHIPITDPTFVEELKQFNAWVNSLKSPNEKDLMTIVLENWVSYRKRFINEISLEEREKLLCNYNISHLSSQLQLVFVGMMGTGKSTIGQAMVELLGGKYINQDALGGKYPRFRKEVKEATSNLDIPLVVIDKCHHNEDVRERTTSEMKMGTMYFVELFHPEDTDFPIKTAELSIKRIAKRGEHHDSLLPQTRLGSIIEGFLASWQPIVDRTNVIRLNVLKTPKELIIDLFNELELPLPIDTIIEEKLELVLKKEKTKKSKIKVLFWSIDVGTLDHLKLDDRIPSYNKLKTHHATIAYLGGKEPTKDDKIIIDQYESGEERILEIEAVAWDENVVALILKADFPCTKKCPHITYSLNGSTLAKYSNTMLESGKYEMIPFSMKLKGIVMPIYN